METKFIRHASAERFKPFRSQLHLQKKTYFTHVRFAVSAFFGMKELCMCACLRVCECMWSNRTYRRVLQSRIKVRPAVDEKTARI